MESCRLFYHCKDFKPISRWSLSLSHILPSCEQWGLLKGHESKSSSALRAAGSSPVDKNSCWDDPEGIRLCKKKEDSFFVLQLLFLFFCKEKETFSKQVSAFYQNFTRASFSLSSSGLHHHNILPLVIPSGTWRTGRVSMFLIQVKLQNRTKISKLCPFMCWFVFTQPRI